MKPSPFSCSYQEARQRFREAASRIGAFLVHYPVVTDGGEHDLTIDVAISGEHGDPAVVISSGVHGVEGFFGSAVQLALLEQLNQVPQRKGVKYVLIHGVNPYGFSQLRRVNEVNVDLNRNFILADATYSGATEGYTRLNSLLNPQSTPHRLDPFKLKVLWNIARHGLQDLKQAVAQGQYEYPQGLFFGGSELTQSASVIQRYCDTWIAGSSSVIHVDFHTGLGKFAQYKLFPAQKCNHGDWNAHVFGPKNMESSDAEHKTAYVVSGLMGDWIQQHFSAIDYRFVVAEFGTYNVIRVLQALRAENCAHHYGHPSTDDYSTAKAELLECFCPQSDAWRKQVVASGLRILRQAEEGVCSRA